MIKEKNYQALKKNIGKCFIDTILFCRKLLCRIHFNYLPIHQGTKNAKLASKEITVHLKKIFKLSETTKTSTRG